jgi:hypothetical protein
LVFILFYVHLKRMKITPLLILATVLITGCFAFGFIYKQITGNYYLTKGETTNTVCVSYSEDKQNFINIVSDSIIEVRWNANYIVVTQIPLDFRQEVIANFTEDFLDSLKTSHQITDIQNESIKLASKNYEILESQLNLREENQKKRILYHLINTQNQTGRSKIFFSKEELETALIKLKVGKLDLIKWEGSFGQIYI